MNTIIYPVTIKKGQGVWAEYNKIYYGIRQALKAVVLNNPMHALEWVKEKNKIHEVTMRFPCFTMTETVYE
jgi:hypothetical protein